MVPHLGHGFVSLFISFMVFTSSSSHTCSSKISSLHLSQKDVEHKPHIQSTSKKPLHSCEGHLRVKRLTPVSIILLSSLFTSFTISSIAVRIFSIDSSNVSKS